MATIQPLFVDSTFNLPINNIKVYADSEQLQQVLVNLIKNAQEANLANDKNNQSSTITVEWQTNQDTYTISVMDEGTGISNIDNLFVPFYTTKKQGSGIGLTLSRQIALNHGGDLSLENRYDNTIQDLPSANETESSAPQVLGAKAVLSFRA